MILGDLGHHTHRRNVIIKAVYAIVSFYLLHLIMVLFFVSVVGLVTDSFIW